MVVMVRCGCRGRARDSAHPVTGCGISTRAGASGGTAGRVTRLHDFGATRKSGAGQQRHNAQTGTRKKQRAQDGEILAQQARCLLLETTVVTVNIRGITSCRTTFFHSLLVEVQQRAGWVLAVNLLVVFQCPVWNGGCPPVRSGSMATTLQQDDRPGWVNEAAEMAEEDR